MTGKDLLDQAGPGSRHPYDKDGKLRLIVRSWELRETLDGKDLHFSAESILSDLWIKRCWPETVTLFVVLESLVERTQPVIEISQIEMEHLPLVLFQIRLCQQFFEFFHNLGLAMPLFRHVGVQIEHA